MWDLATRMEGRHISHRHRANFLYGCAPSVLGDDPRFAWLKQPHRGTIGDELGRLDDDEDSRTMALYLCEHRPTTREAVATIRAYRLETRPAPTIHGLCQALQQALDHYLTTHGAMPLSAVEQALAAVVPKQTTPVRLPKRTPLERLAAFLAQRSRASRLSPARVGSRHSSCAWSCEALSSPACYVYYTLQRSTPCH